MYALSEKQIDFILNDIKIRGVEMEDLQLNLLDHICCVIECELDHDGDFDSFYQKTIPKFFKKELKEIEEETILLLTFKNYYAMKKAMIRTGFFSVTTIILGSLFKLMHWPGAGAMLVLGIGSLALIFIPLMFILKTKDESSKRDKLILGLGSLIGICLCLATLFTVMHWPTPTNGFFWLAATCISAFIFIPVYFITGIRNPDTKLNTIVTTVILIGATGLQFTMINLKPALKLTQIKMYNYIQSEELLKKIQHNSKNLDTSSNKLANEINSKSELIKSMILENSIGEKTIPKDFESRNIEMLEGSLGVGFHDNGNGISENGILILKDLKTAIEKYNSLEMINEKNKIPLAHSIFDIEFDKIERYSNYSVLNSITQIQMYLATAENKITACK
ncbi:MAG: hypothetical protein IPP64_02015 [Bacteroidetes bacterium]|nr:hypothetical protein [Bacteroidota bacterium]